MTESLVDRLARWARERPDAPAYTALGYPAPGSRDGTDYIPHTLTYAELSAAVAGLARDIRARTAPGARIALLTGHGHGYVLAFLACLAADRLAVPLFPVGRHPERLTGIFADATPQLTLIDPGDEISAQFAGSVLAIEPNRTADSPELPKGKAPAYLQYTSGSTGAPTGIRVESANLTAALEQLRAVIPAARHKPIVGWLPFFHDMGLVLTLALPIWSGVHGITLAPVDFVKRPIRWLRACSDFGAGTTGAPDFALALTTATTTKRQVTELNLTSLDAILNGAEPIRAATLRAFTETFTPAGFRHRAHAPGYGLAEATLTVTLTPQDREPTFLDLDRAALSTGYARPASTEPAVTLVGCGPPAGQRIRIVDPENGRPLTANQVGEIQVSGPNVCAPDAENWLHTGDLGFEHHGELYIVGRAKDLVVLDGRNHHPADLEQTAATAAPNIRLVAAFGHDDGHRESLVIVAETPSVDIETTTRIRSAITRVHEVVPRTVLLVPPGEIPRTSSGKIRRGECRKRFAAGELHPH
ncbi:fatty acyl-AMP ligase [Nocardia harenae]|uniref:fatty acyl-AMP ligase n=1 Tax=Nocardia harenae TaxID=358707 RepID=UPI0009FE3E60|nr:fatty acyl-AMP ligase [Nocardia harenae]